MLEYMVPLWRSSRDGRNAYIIYYILVLDAEDTEGKSFGRYTGLTY